MDWKFWKRTVTDEEHEDMKGSYEMRLNLLEGVWLIDVLTPKEHKDLGGEDFECAYDQLVARMLYPDEAA